MAAAKKLEVMACLLGIGLIASLHYTDSDQTGVNNNGWYGSSRLGSNSICKQSFVFALQRTVTDEWR